MNWLCFTLLVALNGHSVLLYGLLGDRATTYVMQEADRPQAVKDWHALQNAVPNSLRYIP